MKRFEFRLERLLSYRRRKKQTQSIEVARSFATVQHEQGRLDALHGQHSVAQDGLRRFRAGTLDANQVLRTEAYDSWLRRNIAGQTRQVQAAEERLDTDRETLTTLARDEKVLDRLRERQAGEHRRETLHANAAELDEIGSVRHQMSRDASHETTEDSDHA